MLTVGEAFSGCESSALRDAIARQSGRFFQAFHAANVQVNGARRALQDSTHHALSADALADEVIGCTCTLLNANLGPPQSKQAASDKPITGLANLFLSR